MINVIWHCNHLRVYKIKICNEMQISFKIEIWANMIQDKNT